jgi:hypothetical protein
MPTLDDLLRQARAVWGIQPMPLVEIAVALGVVHGDICRQARRQAEGQDVHAEELAKELGNLILSAVRWCDDLGYRVGDCVGLAAEAQASYARRLEAARQVVT